MKELSSTFTYKLLANSELSEQEQTLYNAALAAAANAYAPYSHFSVGAAALLADGAVVSGCNQENAAYPSGLCAERVALFAAAATHPAVPVVALAVIAVNGGVTVPSVSPCGACRQVMIETEMRQQQPVMLMMCGKEETRIAPSAACLLPPHFHL